MTPVKKQFKCDFCDNQCCLYGAFFAESNIKVCLECYRPIEILLLKLTSLTFNEIAHNVNSKNCRKAELIIKKMYEQDPEFFKLYLLTGP